MFTYVFQLSNDSGRLDSGRLGSGRLGACTLDAWTLDSRRLVSGQLDTWTLEAWILDDRTLGLWTTGHLDSGRMEAWTLDGYGSVKIAMDSCYNSNLLQLIFSFKVPWETTILCKVQLLIKRKLTLESLKQVINFFPKNR